MATINGTSKTDWLFGTGNADVINGLQGDDTLKGGGGADRLDGGSGTDGASYLDSAVGVWVDLGAGFGRHGIAEGDTLISIENVLGSPYGDLLYGSISPNQLTGLDGNDTLNGRGGADVLDGGFGNDLLIGGGSADRLDGGEGNDIASYYDSPGSVTVSLAGDFASGGYAEGDDLNSIENVSGSEFSDALIGDNGANILDGFDGHDILKGLGGHDTLWGYEGDDSIEGGDGNDELTGDPGNDTLDGGSGADHMYGGSGRDTFLFASIADLGLTMATSDWVLDVNADENDRLDISGIDADVYTPGDQDFTFIGTAAFSGTPGEIRYFTVGEPGFQEIYFELQTGTSTDIEGMIHVGVSLTTPSASWFYL